MGSEVSGHDSAGVINCVISELPTTHKQLMGESVIPLLRSAICITIIY